MPREKIMIVDDEQDARDIVEEFLRHAGFDVLSVSSGLAALDLLKNERPENLPHLIILDVRMPEMDGIEVCQRLKSDLKTKHIPILMLTLKDSVEEKVKGLNKGANDYLSKTSDNSELLARIRSLLRSFKKKPFEPAEESLLNIYCSPAAKTYIQCSGNLNIINMSKNQLELDIDKYSRYADNLPKLKADWRSEAKRIGTDLFEALISKHSDISSVYFQAMGAVLANKDLHIKMLSNREFLRVPLECLFANGEYLCLQHPLVRTIEAVVVRKQPVSPSFFNRLHSEGETLRILIIGANTDPPIAGVDREVQALETCLHDAFTSKGIKTSVNVIPSDDATYDNVRHAIKDSAYHIVHYCGHGSYDAGATERSCLHLWEDTRKDRTRPLPAAELKSLVGGSDIRFIYLSCCLGTATGAQKQLLDGDFLGIADALIQAGIPSVLGFRWPVADDGAVQLAVTFYDTLARDGRLDFSLLEARKLIKRDDLTWLSPVLIAQK